MQVTQWWNIPINFNYKTLVGNFEMVFKSVFSLTILLSTANLVTDQNEGRESEPVELDVLKSYVGVWDAQIEVWSNGPDAASIKFKGVETNRAFGKHWIASDFDSVFMGQKTQVHSIIGYDLDKKKWVGTVVDYGPYAASMIGDYDKKSKTIQWITKAKTVKGKPMLQKTLVTQTSDSERSLVLMVPGEKEGEFTKLMKIKFVKRKK